MKEERLLSRDAVIVLAASFFYLSSVMLANPLVAGFAEELGAGVALMGALAALMSVCSLVVRPFAGNLSDRLSKRALAAAGATLMCATALGQALAPNTAVLAVLRLANGAGYSLCSVCMATWFAEMLPASRVGQGMGLFGLMNALGVAVGPAAGIAVAGAAGFRLALCASALLAALSLAGILLARSAPRSAPAPARAASARIRLLDRRAVPAALIVMLFTIPYMATQSFLVSYVGARGLDVPTGAFFTVYAVALMALRVALGRAFDRVGLGRFLAVSSASALGSLALLAVMGGPVELFLAAPLMAGGYGVMCSVCQATAVRAVGKERVGLANSTYYMGLDLGMIGGPLVGGWVMELLGPGALYPALMVCVPLACVVWLASRMVFSPRE